MDILERLFKTSQRLSITSGPSKMTASISWRKNSRHEKYGSWWVVFKVMWEAVFVYVDFSTAEINGVECFALVVFFGTFPPQVLTSLYRCSCLLSDKISCCFLAGPSMPAASCADGFAGGGSSWGCFRDGSTYWQGTALSTHRSDSLAQEFAPICFLPASWFECCKHWIFRRDVVG